MTVITIDHAERNELRDQNYRLTAKAAELMTDNSKLQAEVDRQAAALEAFQINHDDLRQACSRQYAEIEQLRATLERHHHYQLSLGAKKMAAYQNSALYTATRVALGFEPPESR
jgi:predicted  nucleic acid-binding Zn-ribbon protein